jgi:hypothetical protein
MAEEKVLISYSHKDKKWREDLDKHLKPYLRDGSIVSWSDQQIAPGSEWFRDIQSALTNSKVAVLLVSSDFLASDFIHEHELGPLFKELKQGGVKILWVPVSASSYEKTPLKDYQALLDPENPLDGMADADREKAWVKICKQIEKAVKEGNDPDSSLTCKPTSRLGPEKISVARLPVTGSDVFGREQDIAFLDSAWVNQQVNIVTIVAWAGVGKSTLVNHWLRRMAADHYRSAELVFGWSFYRQGTSRDASSADEFLDAALTWFGDPDPRVGTAWQKGERLAKLVADRRTLLVLDGLEPLQNPFGAQEGRLREPSLQALLRELAAFNKGLCLITTRLAAVDLADYEPTSSLRLDLEHLSSDAGAKLLRASGVKGDEAKLRSASDEFSGHCLALTLLGSYLTDAYNGDIRCREEVSKRLIHDVRQGKHARKVMASYQDWFGEGPELSVLRLLGFFDRPADERTLEALLKPPATAGLTEPLLAGPNTEEWRAVLSRLRRAKLIAEEDPSQPGQLDAHPLVREYFGEQLQGTSAWKEGNRRLYEHYRDLASQQPDLFRNMEPLFLAVICGCRAGLLRDALHKVYIPRIQRRDASFAAKVLGVRGTLLSVLVHFFEQGRWGPLAQTDVDDQSLTADDQLFLLLQAGLYLTTLRGMGAREARICYKHAEPLCYSLGRQLDLYPVLLSKWRSSLMTDKLSATLQIAKDIDSLAQGKNGAVFMDLAYRTLAITLFYLGDFESARQYTMRAVQLWCAEEVPSTFEEAYSPAVLCLCYKALCEWHFGETTVCNETMEKALSLAKDELKDMYAYGVALWFAAFLGHFEHDAAQVELRASDLIKRATRHQFAHWLPAGKVFSGWARSASGYTAEGVAWIEEGIRAHQALGYSLNMPYWLVIKAEALYLADRIPEALGTIEKAEAAVENFEERCWSAELHRLRGLFLAAQGAEETEIETSFRAAIRIASDQKSVSLEKRAKASYAEYRRQKVSTPGGHGFRLPLC